MTRTAGAAIREDGFRRAFQATEAAHFPGPTPPDAPRGGAGLNPASPDLSRGVPSGEDGGFPSRFIPALSTKGRNLTPQRGHT